MTRSPELQAGEGLPGTAFDANASAPWSTAAADAGAHRPSASPPSRMRRSPARKSWPRISQCADLILTTGGIRMAAAVREVLVHSAPSASDNRRRPGLGTSRVGTVGAEDGELRHAHRLLLPGDPVSARWPALTLPAVPCRAGPQSIAPSCAPPSTASWYPARPPRARARAHRLCPPPPSWAPRAPLLLSGRSGGLQRSRGRPRGRDDGAW